MIYIGISLLYPSPTSMLDVTTVTSCAASTAHSLFHLLLGPQAGNIKKIMLTIKTDFVLVCTCMNSTKQQTNNKTHHLQYNQEYYWNSLFILFLQFPTELLAHSQENCKILGLTQTNILNLLISTCIHQENTDILVIATTNPATLSPLRSITKVSGLDPAVNHSIFRTEAFREILGDVTPILEASV